MSKVFFSFSKEDSSIVATYEAILRANGHEVLCSTTGSLLQGTSSDFTIAAVLKECDYVLVFLSRAFAFSPWVKEITQVVYEENQLGQIKLIAVNLEQDQQYFPEIFVRAPHTIKDRLIFTNSSESDFSILLKYIFEKNKEIEKLPCYTLDIPMENLTIYHFGEEFFHWQRDRLDLLYFEGIGQYFLFDVAESGSEFKNYVKFISSDKLESAVIAALRSAHLILDSNDITESEDGTRCGNIFFLDRRFNVVQNGDFLNNVWP